tara:strand:+ start:384 stop:593 length:210 start_codon:yes stop_codon:yes gene_type:complete
MGNPLKRVIEIQGRMFQIKRRFPEYRINIEKKDSVSILKQFFHCDTIFKNQGYFWFCNEIKEISYEEIR